MLEAPDSGDAVYRATTSYLAGIRHFFESLARQAGIPQPEDFARKWQMLMKGAIVAAYEGDRDAARRAKEVAQLLLMQAMPATPSA
jgi:hypothetical protein